MKRQSIKMLITCVGSFLFFFFLNTGFYEEPLWQVLQAVVFSAIVVLITSKRVKRLWFIYFFFILMAVMVVSIVLESVFIAELIGSTAFGLIIIFLAFYLPDFVKDGYLKKW